MRLNKKLFLALAATALLSFFQMSSAEAYTKQECSAKINWHWIYGGCYYAGYAPGYG